MNLKSCVIHSQRLFWYAQLSKGKDIMQCKRYVDEVGAAMAYCLRLQAMELVMQSSATLSLVLSSAAELMYTKWFVSSNACKNDPQNYHKNYYKNYPKFTLQEDTVGLFFF